MALTRSNPATFQWNVTEKQNRNIPGRMSQLQQTLRDLTNLKKQEGSGFRGMLGTTAKSIGQVAERGRQQQEKQDLKDYEEERLREQRTYQEGQTADQRAYAENQKRLEIERQEGQEADDEYKELRTNALNNLLATYKEDITPENVDEIIGLAKGIIDTIEYYPEDEAADKRFKEKLASQFENHARVFATPEAINISSEEFTNWQSIIQERALEVLAQTKDADGNPNLKYTTDEDGVEIPDLVNSNWGPYYAEIERLLADGGIVEDENLRVALRRYYSQEEQGDNKNIDLNKDKETPKETPEDTSIWTGVADQDLEITGDTDITRQILGLGQTPGEGNTTDMPNPASVSATLHNRFKNANETIQANIPPVTPTPTGIVLEEEVPIEDRVPQELLNEPGVRRVVEELKSIRNMEPSDRTEKRIKQLEEQLEEVIESS